jgi:L-fucose isomerase-like protein
MGTNSFKQSTFGIIIGNRDFFPDKLVAEARTQVLEVLKKQNITPILLNETDSKLGGVETFADAQKCAALFKQHADTIDGILVVLPNFGDEKGVAETIKLSG